MYFEHCGIWNRLAATTVLHIAPERHLRNAIVSRSPGLYIAADVALQSKNSIAFDMHHMPLKDSSVDLVIANHVLEHVADPSRALDEAYRVLKAGALAVFQTPYSPLLSTTLAIDAVKAEDARELLYGQYDHMRLFGRDLFPMIEAAGFTNSCIAHTDLPDREAEIYGVNAEEPFFLFRKA